MTKWLMFENDQGVDWVNGTEEPSRETRVDLDTYLHEVLCCDEEVLIMHRLEARGWRDVEVWDDHGDLRVKGLDPQGNMILMWLEHLEAELEASLLAEGYQDVLDLLALDGVELVDDSRPVEELVEVRLFPADHSHDPHIYAVSIYQEEITLERVLEVVPAGTGWAGKMIDGHLKRWGGWQQLWRCANGQWVATGMLEAHRAWLNSSTCQAPVDQVGQAPMTLHLTLDALDDYQLVVSDPEQDHELARTLALMLAYADLTLALTEVRHVQSRIAKLGGDPLGDDQVLGDWEPDESDPSHDLDVTVPDWLEGLRSYLSSQGLNLAVWR